MTGADVGWLVLIIAGFIAWFFICFWVGAYFGMLRHRDEWREKGALDRREGHGFKWSGDVQGHKGWRYRLFKKWYDQGWENPE